jgi:hypothetical protein
MEDGTVCLSYMEIVAVLSVHISDIDALLTSWPSPSTPDEALKPVPGPLDRSVSDGDGLLAFHVLTEEETEQICQVLRSSGSEPHIALGEVEGKLLFESSSDTDDEDWDADDLFSLPGPKTITHPRILGALQITILLPAVINAFEQAGIQSHDIMEHLANHPNAGESGRFSSECTI